MIRPRPVCGLLTFVAATQLAACLNSTPSAFDDLLITMRTFGTGGTTAQTCDFGSFCSVAVDVINLDSHLRFAGFVAEGQFSHSMAATLHGDTIFFVDQVSRSLVGYRRSGTQVAAIPLTAGPPPDYEFYNIEIDPVANRLYVGDVEQLRVFDTGTMTEVASSDMGGRTYSLSLSPDRTRLAVTGAWGSARILDAATLSTIHDDGLAAGWQVLQNRLHLNADETRLFAFGLVDFTPTDSSRAVVFDLTTGTRSEYRVDGTRPDRTYHPAITPNYDGSSVYLAGYINGQNPVLDALAVGNELTFPGVYAFPTSHFPRDMVVVRRPAGPG